MLESIAMVLIVLLLVLVMYPLCIYGGYKIAIRTGVDYKKRWREALTLVETQNQLAEVINSDDAQLIVAQIEKLRQETTKLHEAQAKLPPPSKEWLLKVEYGKTNYGEEMVRFYAVKGNHKVKVGEQGSPELYPASFETAQRNAKAQIVRMNRAEA